MLYFCLSYVSNETQNTNFQEGLSGFCIGHWPLLYLSSTYMVLLTWTLFSVCLSMGVECSETGNQKLDKFDKVRFLSVIFDDNLNWEPQIQYVNKNLKYTLS